MFLRISLFIALFFTLTSSYYNEGTAFINSPVFREAHVGVLAINVGPNDTLIRWNENKLFTPASNTKLYSYYIFRNFFQSDSLIGLKYHQNRDSIFIRLFGDPTFLHPDFLHQKIFDFLKKQEQAIIFERGKPLVPYGEGWQLDDVGTSYLQELSWHPIYGNTLRVLPKQNTVQPTYFKPNITLDTINSRTLCENSFRVNRNKDTVNFSFISGEKLFKKLLQDTLKKEVHFHDSKSKKDSLIYTTVYSQPLDSIYKRILVESDNFFTEQLMIQTYAETNTLSFKKHLKSVMKKHLHDFPTPYRIVDASGVSRYNLTSPANTVHLLSKIYKDSMLYKKTLEVLPKLYESGTLKNFGENNNTQPAGFFAGKSGTLRNNYCLSGYLLSKKGNTIVISIMVNHFTSNIKEVKKEIETFFTYIYENY